MPDITMCSGESCPKKEQCYRHTAVPSTFRQSYFLNPPVLTEERRTKDGACDYFWTNKKEGKE